jgi:hypothetical protein
MIRASLPATPVTIPVDDHEWLAGDLVVPPAAQGLVLFAHGSGSSRNSPRNQRVAAQLNERRLATLLVDLLTPAEDRIDAQTAFFRLTLRGWRRV